jgi:hydroxypyruvate reductase/glycerate 2-kinase
MGAPRRNSVKALREDALAIWIAGVRSVDAGFLLRRAVRVRGNTLVIGAELRIPLDRVRRIVVVGAGKAGGAMAEALEDVLGERRLEAHDVRGCVNVPDTQVHPLRRVELHAARAGYDNNPTEAGAAGAARMLDHLRDLGPHDLVLCLLSGGGSALLPAPAAAITLEDKLRTTRLLHSCGATINEMNAVRKHLSRVKGGRLAEAAGGARVVSLIVSDVVGDPLDVIASGPTAPDPTTYADALAVLAKYALEARTPARVLQHLRRGAAGELTETAKRLPSRVRNVVIGNNALAMRGAARLARARGYRVLDLGARIEGESREVGIVLAGLVRSVREAGRPLPSPACILSGGETTVTLGGEHGLGGRNQELVLSALAHLGEPGLRGAVVLCGGTDGEDGPTDAAGALADAGVARAARILALDPRDFLARHDAYSFFARTGGLVRTGPTRTNVMDLRVALVGA